MDDVTDPDLRAALASRAALLRAVPDAVVVAASDGTVVDWNPAAEQMFGRSASTVLGAPVSMLMPERFRPAHQEGLRRLATGGRSRMLGTTQELVGLRADGAEFPLELSLGHWEDGAGTHFVGILRDISDRKLAEQVLRREQELLALLERVAQSANTATTVAGAVQTAVDAVCRWADWPVGHAFLAHPDGSLRTAGAWFSSDADRYRALQETSAASVLQPGQGLPGRVLARGAAVELELTPDLDLPRLPVLLGAGLALAYGFPIQVGEKVVGALEFFDTSSTGLPADLLEVMGNITAQIGRVVEREIATVVLTQEEARFRALVEQAADVVLVVDGEGRISYASAATEELGGWPPDEVTGRCIRDFLDPADLDRVRPWRETTATTTGRTGMAEMQVRRADGSRLEVEVVANNRLDDPAVAGIVVHVRDITQRRRAEHELAYARLHDPLTGLPNRLLFDERVADAAERARRYGWSDAVLAVDLDDFGAINDRLGTAEGDAVLRRVAERLQRVVRPYDAVTRPHDTLARVGSDEFLLLCENIEDADSAAAIAERVLLEVSACLEDDGQAARLTATIGIAFARGTAADPMSPVADAQVALRQARRSGAAATYAIFADEIRVEDQQRAALLRDLARAVERDQLVLHYQPKVQISSGRILGAEALIRWQHPERGLVPPLEFIPLAEQTGLIEPIGAWVLHEACRQAARWRADLPEMAPPLVCVNVSARQFRTDLAGTVSAALSTTGLPAAGLVLEVTESVVMDDVDQAIDVLTALKGLGVSVSIDDFGTGYSSLAYLKRLPLDEIKIDRSFVNGLGSDPEDTAITAAVTAMGHALGLLVVAEGVETALQLDRLGALGCDLAQGYHFSRPVPAREMTQLLAGGQSMIPGADGRRGPRRVLVADDAAEVRQLARVSLSTAGFEVHEAEDGQQALDLARRIRPDCLVLDVQMPQLTGFEVCQAVRADPELAGCTVLLLTASADARDKVEGYSVGADDYVVKPFAPRDLVARVRHALAARAATSAG